jgi:hypothetical protein
MSAWAIAANQGLGADDARVHVGGSWVTVLWSKRD